MERDRNVGTSAFWGGVLNLEDFEVVHQRHDAAEKVWHFTVVPTQGGPDAIEASGSRPRQEGAPSAPLA